MSVRPPYDRPPACGAALVMDRFLRTRDGWLDVATNRAVTLVDAGPGGAATPCWLARCAALVAHWHSHVAPLVDYGIVGADTRVEAYPRLAAAARGGFAWWGWQAVHAWFHARGLSAGPIDADRIVGVGGRALLQPHAETALCAEQRDGVRDEAFELRRLTRGRPVPRDARAIGLSIVQTEALDGIAAVLEEGRAESMVVRVDARPGAGLTTLLSAAAREARRRGLVAVCPGSLERPGVVELLRDRTVVLLLDARVGTERAGLRALATLLRHPLTLAGAVGVLGARSSPCPAFTLAGIPLEALLESVWWFPAASRDRVTRLVRRSEGLPKRLVSAWLESAVAARRPSGAGVPLDTARRTAGLRQRSAEISYVAEGRPTSAFAGPAALRALPVDVSVKERAVLDAAWRCWRGADPAAARRGFERFLEAAVDIGDQRVCEAMWGIGVCALDEAKLRESERWLRAASASIDASGPDADRLTRGVAAALARCLRWQGRLGDASALLRDRASARADEWPACRERARIEMGAGRTAPALAWLARALKACGDVPAARAAIHGDYARAHRQAGDRLGAAVHLREAVRSGRRAEDRRGWLRLRVVHLELLTLAPGGPSRGAVLRAAGRCLRATVPALVRLRAQRALEALGWRRTQQVAAFVERWGEGALWPPSAGEIVMVSDLQAVLEICRDTDEPLPALERVCHCVRDRLRAASVAIHGAPAERGRLALAGSPRLSTTPLAQRLLDSGVAARAAPADAGVEAGVPVTYAGRTIGAVVCRWTVDRLVDASQAELLLVAAAIALAPHLQGVLDRERRRIEATDDTLGLLGESPLMQALRERIRRVALAPFHVLIEGESGSGKEVVARALHSAGPRRHRRFCALNCAALTDDLIEAELFGHARGAFTGAVGERPGLFEEADGGTLFLDEVGELSPRAQAKLLRAIQDGEVRRVGENLARRVDPRLIAATNRHLRDEVASGRFRADLCYRLDVVRIGVPPLRERPDDVVLLARTFWADAVARLGSRATLHPGTVAALARYDWPGNVRELQNVVMALAVNAPARGAVLSSRLPAAIAAQADGESAITLDAARRSFEERFVRAALARAGNRPGRAARELGLTRQGFRKVLARLRIDSSSAASAARPAGVAADRAASARLER